MEKAEEMIKAVKKNYEYGDEKKGAILDQMLKMPGNIQSFTKSSGTLAVNLTKRRSTKAGQT